MFGLVYLFISFHSFHFQSNKSAMKIYKKRKHCFVQVKILNAVSRAAADLLISHSMADQFYDALLGSLPRPSLLSQLTQHSFCPLPSWVQVQKGGPQGCRPTAARSVCWNISTLRWPCPHPRKNAAQAASYLRWVEGRNMVADKNLGMILA